MKLLETSDYDEAHALVLSKMHDFKEGRLFIYDKQMLYNEIVQFYMDNDDYENVIASCKKYSKNDPNLWIKALSYFSNKEPDERDFRSEIGEILRNIEDSKLLPPLQVIQLLSKSPNSYLGLIKPYISSYLKSEQTLIDEDNKKIRKSIEETQKYKKEIEKLKSGAILVTNSKCNFCTQQLYIPAVHFLCNHSYHQHCLGENENECPECEKENSDFKNRQRSLEENAKKHKEFFRQLEQNVDGFSVVANFFWTWSL